VPEIVRAGGTVRGTQSFVHVMSSVWRRPSLTAMEVAWRWVVGVVVLYVGSVALGSYGIDVHLAVLRNARVFQPVAAIQSFGHVGGTLWAYAEPSLRMLIPVVLALWLTAAAIGRTIVLGRMDRTLKPRWATMFVLGIVRAGLVAVVWGLLLWIAAWAVRVTILRPAAAHADPNLVLLCAIVIVAALGLYVLWAIFSWPFYLSPLLAMERGLGPFGALRAALRGGTVRGKLIEINLVMNIVKIAVLVLAMVFSASPLPFSSVETQTFLNCWWSGVILLTLVALDYFHIVRSAAYLSLWRTYNISDSGVSAGK
jgi:hypothetical protein